MWNFLLACGTQWSFHVGWELCLEQPQEVSPCSWIAKFSPRQGRSIIFKPDRWGRHPAIQCRLLSSHPSRQPHPEHFTPLQLGHLIGKRHWLKLTLSFLSLSVFYEIKTPWEALNCGCSSEGAGDKHLRNPSLTTMSQCASAYVNESSFL